jgi:hypothetical protein
MTRRPVRACSVCPRRCCSSMIPISPPMVKCVPTQKLTGPKSCRGGRSGASSSADPQRQEAPPGAAARKVPPAARGNSHQPSSAPRRLLDRPLPARHGGAAGTSNAAFGRDTAGVDQMRSSALHGFEVEEVIFFGTPHPFDPAGCETNTDTCRCQQRSLEPMGSCKGSARGPAAPGRPS